MALRNFIVLRRFNLSPRLGMIKVVIKRCARRILFCGLPTAVLLCGVTPAWALEASSFYELNGSAEFDIFGAAIASIGDIDGDGVPDFVVGVPRTNANDIGSAFVFSGVDGGLIYSFNGLNAGDNFGISVAGTGDVNGDGVPDIAVGAPFMTVNGQVLLGSVFYFSGNDGSLIRRINGDPQTSTLGGAIANAGDLNGDGVPELIVGAAVASPTNFATGVGSILVYSGATGSTLLRIDGTVTGENFGELVASAGDVNGDAVPDILVGLPKASPAGLFTAGSVFVFSGLNGDQLLRFDGSIEFANFGSSITTVGDINGDGQSDIIIGDPSFELFNGRVFAFSGKDGTELWRVDDTNSSVSFGYTVASAGDVNGDGVPDVLVGDPNASGLSGSVFFLSGVDGAQLLRIDGAGGGFGRALASAGDLNGDQVPDVIIGAKDAGPSGFTSAGTVFISLIADSEDGNTASFSDGVLSIPIVQVGDIYYRVDLILTDEEALEFQLGPAEQIFDPNTVGISSFSNNVLSIPEVIVGNTSFRVELTLTNSTTITFVLSDFEEL